MCRYSTAPYKPHYACFECRKTFKRRLMSDINRDDKRTVEAKCPQCGQLMADMGLDFASPPKDHIKAWAHLKDLYTVGITFHSCGCSGPGYIPASPEQLYEYLEEIKQTYLENLAFWRNRIEPETKKEKVKDQNNNWYELSSVSASYKKTVVSNQEGIHFWLNKIKEVEQQLITLKR